MVKEERSIVIHRPVAEVFAFVADQTNAPRWQDGVLEVRRTTEGAPGIGTQHTFVRKFMGRRLESGNEYTEYEPNQKVAFRSASDPMKFVAWYRTEPAQDGTKLTSGVEMHPSGFISVAEPLIPASLRREMEGNLAELKDLLERQAVPGHT